MAKTGEDVDKTKSFQVDFACGNGVDDEEKLRSQWATVERLPTFKRVTTALLHTGDDSSDIIDVTKLEDAERRLMIEKLVKQIEADNLRLLRKIRKRIDE